MTQSIAGFCYVDPSLLPLQKMILQPGGLPTKVVCLTNCVNLDELRDDEEFQDIFEDMRLEGERFGTCFKLLSDLTFPPLYIHSCVVIVMFSILYISILYY